MTGYAAFGRVERTRPHDVPGWPASRPGLAGDDGAVVIETAAPTAPRHLASVHERLSLAREQWAITTFYLFDPDSWR